jgi:NitT/TauT family transport system permease protein
MRGWRMVFASVVGIAVFGAIWEVGVRLADVREFVLLPPSKILAELADDPRTYFDAALVTARHAALGIAIALAISLVVGAALASSRFLEQAAQPVLVLILVAPWVAYFTSIVTWLGRGDPPVVFLVTLVTVPAFTFAAVSGMRSSDASARELLASVNASRLEVLWRLRLPSALPVLLATSRYAIGLALAAAYYGEGGNLTSVAEGGLGTIGRSAASLNRGRPLWATVFATVLLGVIGLGLVSLAERVLLRWHVSQRRTSFTSAAARMPRRWLP